MQSCRKWRCEIYALVVFLFFFSGCSSSQRRKEVVVKPPPPPPVEVAKPVSKGSLYTGYDNLFSDPKAHQVGDIITIKVVESLSGEGSSSNSVGKQTQMGIDLQSPTILGKKIPGDSLNPLLGFQANPQSSFSGQGATKRNTKLIATITARVTKVYPNGNLYIEGEKVIRINDDVQILKISGMISPTDIEQDNSISSSKISDMYVEYNGKGFWAESQRPGWLARFLMKIWPF
ncbi:flagellar basal body L-ring protein FlgH [Desulfurobacterium atlanticum]|uniref:Flagellar L-ring protein n=1 Tax=Desulfurobacterium atlanticum TaxID=240169 RepID=A0A239A0I7_9BACT|nr:flagellar basal body L-ring protein FlgH [Desulfurobacterium atlanticum]SNR88628.1 flagellar L-ring protein precursor FlgH [Desulfurobacterium atlanticum]